MKHAHQSQFGRPMTAVLGQDDVGSGIDKWTVLERLTQARDAYGLSHRTLGVLRALMTFLPERVLTTAHQSAIVFPSNATLSERLNGMPESTLRRHIATLVQRGIVSRHDSANRKRFARRAGQGRRIAFGFDLSALARMWPQIDAAAKQTEAQQEEIAALRSQVAALRQHLLCLSGDTSLTDTARRLLRRKCSATDLAAMAQALGVQIEALEPDEMSGTDNQNERHIEEELKSNSVVSEASEQHTSEACAAIVVQCTEYKSYFPEASFNWSGLASIADRLCPMMGIDASVYGDAIQKMGLARAITAVLCILERLAEIANPGGYLRRLAQRGAEGRFCLERLEKMVHSPRNCQLTI